MRDWNQPQVGRPEEMRPELPDWVNEKFEPFDIHGSGLIFLSKATDSRTGDANGFVFMDSACTYGLCGGVLDQAEARRLAEYIINALDPAPTGQSNE